MIGLCRIDDLMTEYKQVQQYLLICIDVAEESRGDHMLRQLKLQWSVSPRLVLLSIVKKCLLAFLPMDNIIVERINRYRQHILSNWFAIKYADIVKRYCGMTETAKPFDKHDKPVVWLLWMQGKSQIPESCRVCVESILRQNSNVRLLDYDEAMNLVSIPDKIREGYEAGRVKPAHVADYIRFALLEQYGGIWMDVSLLQLRPTPPDVFEFPFFSVKGLLRFPYASAMPLGRQWQVYYMASWPHALFNRIMLSLLEAYYSEYDVDVDYFITYYMAQLTMTIGLIHNEYNMIPSNNIKCEHLNTMIERREYADSDVLNVLNNESTWFYKCSTHYEEEEQRKMRHYLQLYIGQHQTKE